MIIVTTYIAGRRGCSKPKPKPKPPPPKKKKPLLPSFPNLTPPKPPHSLFAPFPSPSHQTNIIHRFSLSLSPTIQLKNVPPAPYFIYTNIYTYRERKREREKDKTHMYNTYIHTYAYAYNILLH